MSVNNKITTLYCIDTESNPEKTISDYPIDNTTNVKSGKVAVNFVKPKNYPNKIPFDPPERYSEYSGNSLDPENHIYAGVRDTLYNLGLDSENFNTEEWNPFRELITPGMTVFIKPNTVVHKHEQNKDIYSVIVHASILRPILDYVCKALNNKGKIIIGDSQLIFSDHKKALKSSLIEGLLAWYVNQTPVQIECIDLRVCRGVRTWLYGKWGRVKVEEDGFGYRFVDLGDRSCLNGIDPKRFRVAIANPENMYKHHSKGKHEYLFPRSILESDVIISIPKLKTHRRTAVTLALKNFMGIPSWKDSLPHYITGSVKEGGDQYLNPSIRKRICTRLHDEIHTNPYIPIKFVCAVIKKMVWNSHKIFPFKDDIFEGMWKGNDTLWRTLLDLNRAVVYADKDGKIRDTPQRKTFFFMDGVIGGEKDGPLEPDPVPSGVLMAGTDSVTIDAVAATLMGFDIERIPLIKKAFEHNNGLNPLFEGKKEDIQIVDEEELMNLAKFSKKRHLHFEAHPNWKGEIERD